MSILLETSVVAEQPELWTETFGEPQICVAVLDSWVDQSHPSLADATLTQLEPLVPNVSSQGAAAQHGTQIASIILGQHHSFLKGLAPQCRGLVIPIFTDGKREALVEDLFAGAIDPCSQLDLARAILLVANHGAHIINISGGQLTASSEAALLLANAVRHCVDQNILIVAAVGNDGCTCLHIPGALPSVLTVSPLYCIKYPC